MYLVYQFLTKIDSLQMLAIQSYIKSFFNLKGLMDSTTEFYVLNKFKMNIKLFVFCDIECSF